MNSKRGQELSITTLILIVIGIVVAVILILGFTLGFDFVFGKIKLLPGQDLEAVAQSCNVAAGAGLKIDYCDTFKKISLDGKSQYVNCLDERVQRGVSAENKGKIDCGDKSESEDRIALEQGQCKKLAADLRSISSADSRKDCRKLIVNGLVCGTGITAPDCANPLE